MQLAESFAAAFKPQFFSDKLFASDAIPKLEFIIIEDPKQKESPERALVLDDDSGFVTKGNTWVEEEAQSLIHLPKDRLGVWKGINQTNAPAYQEWQTCVGRMGMENTNKDPEKCPKKQINYTTSCEEVFNETSFEYTAECKYCVQFFNMSEPECTDPCEFASSYINDVGEKVFDMTCIDPIYQKKLDRAPKPTMPPGLRVIVQIISWMMEMFVVMIAILPWYAILLVYMLMDFLLDWIWYALFFWWCLPCAWIFIWLFNIVFMPFTIWGYVVRFQLELVGFAFDFWLLFFNGDGCFLRWGKYCWFARRIPGRDNMTYMDSIAFNKYGEGFDLSNPLGTMDQAIYGMQEWIKNQIKLQRPQVEQFQSKDWFAVGQDKRQALAETCPGMPETLQFFRDQFEALAPIAENYLTSFYDM